MIIKKYYKFLYFFLFFVKTHVIQASLVDGVVTLPKQCESCVRLQFQLQELQGKYIEMGGNQIAVLAFGKNATQINSEATTQVNECILILKELQGQNKKLEHTAILAILQNRELEKSNKLLKDQKNELQNKETILETSVKNLTDSNTKLTDDLKKENVSFEKMKNQNMSLQSQVFYYKCALSITVLLLIMSLTYPKIINKK